VVPSDPDQAYALRATDGRPVPIAELSTLIKNSVAITATGLVRVDRKSRARVPGGAMAQISVSAFDPVTQTAAWTRECPPRSRFAFVDDRHLFILDETTGECSLLAIDSGQIQSLGSAPASNVQEASEMYAVADARQVYVLINEPGTSNSYIQPPSLRISGTIIALARNQSSGSSPCRIRTCCYNGSRTRHCWCACRMNMSMCGIGGELFQRGCWRWTGTGRIVVDDTRATPNGNYYRVDLSRTERAIDILSHNSRMRIQAVKAPAAVE
jgi:hypothetical protein